MARRRKSKFNSLLILFVGVVGGFMLANSCSVRTSVTSQVTRVQPETKKIIKRLVTQEEIARHKHCMATTKSQGAFEDCVTGENHTL